MASPFWFAVCEKQAGGGGGGGADLGGFEGRHFHRLLEFLERDEQLLSLGIGEALKVAQPRHGKLCCEVTSTPTTAFAGNVLLGVWEPSLRCYAFDTLLSNLMSYPALVRRYPDISRKCSSLLFFHNTVRESSWSVEREEDDMYCVQVK